jgi:hypothetical protein
MGHDQRLIEEWEDYLNNKVKNVKFPLEYKLDLEFPEFTDNFKPEEPKEKETKRAKEVKITKKNKNSLF